MELLGWEHVPNCEGSGSTPLHNHIKEMQLIDMRKVPVAHYWTVDPETLKPIEISPTVGEKE